MTAKFWNRLAKRYARAPVRHEDDYQEKLRKTREYLTPDSNVFEFGCGTGSTAIAHAPFVRHIHATDYSTQMIEIARGKAEAAGIGNISFDVADFYQMDMSPDRFDMVMGHSILHLLEDVPLAISRVRSMLKPGGIFVTSTGCVSEVGGILKALLNIVQIVRLIPRINAFSQADLEAMLVEAGFEIEYVWRPGKNKAAFIVARNLNENS